MNNSIEIRHLTIVINLKNSSATSYLNFMEESKIIRQIDKFKIITSSKVNNNYLVIYVDNKPTGIFLTTQIIESLIKNDLDFVAIDELFPDDNSLLLNRKDCQNSSSWIKSYLFDNKNSYITVEIC